LWAALYHRHVAVKSDKDGLYNDNKKKKQSFHSQNSLCWSRDHFIHNNYHQYQLRLSQASATPQINIRDQNWTIIIKLLSMTIQGGTWNIVQHVRLLNVDIFSVIHSYGFVTAEHCNQGYIYHAIVVKFKNPWCNL